MQIKKENAMDVEMIERCIDALEKQFKEMIEKASGQTFEETKITLPKRSNWREYVLCVIKAMREPTDKMADAAHNAGNWTRAKADWRAMIDSITND